MKTSDLKIPFLLVAVLSLIALLPMPYGYYIFLKIAVTGLGGITAYLLYTSGKKDWMVFNALKAGLFSYFYWRDFP